MRFDAQFTKYRGESVIVDFRIAHLPDDAGTSTVYADPVFLLISDKNKIFVNTNNTIANNTYLSYTYKGVTGTDGKYFTNYNFIVKPAVSLLTTQTSKYHLDITFKHLIIPDYVIIKRIIMFFDSSYNI